MTFNRTAILNNITRRTHPTQTQIFLTSAEFETPLREQIPACWFALLDAKTFEQMRYGLRALWQPIIPYAKEFLDTLEEKIQGVAVGVADNLPPALLYLFSLEGELFLRQGFLPLHVENMPEHQRRIWETLPLEVRALYTIHNGWGDLYGTDGHLPVEKWWCLADIWDPANPHEGIDLAQTIIMFENGGGSYLGFETPAANATPPLRSRAVISWHNGRFDRNREFMNTFSAWVSAQLDEFDITELP